MAQLVGPIIGGALGTVGTIFGAVAGMKADKKLSQLQKEDPVYHGSPYAHQQLGLAQSLLNARMPGAAAQERNIYSNQANYLGQVNRNATDSSQALALAGMAQGQTNQAFNQLGIQEAQDYNNRLQNMNQAYGVATEDKRAVFDDRVRRWQDQVNILMAQNSMRQAGAQSISNLGGSMGSSMTGAMGSGGGMMGG
jgi:hypothetical protein